MSSRAKSKLSRPAKAQKTSGGKASKTTRRAGSLWRDPRGRFARPVSYVVKGPFRDTFYDRTGHVTGFATQAPKPKEAFAREVASVDRRRKKAPVKVTGPKITKPKPRKAPAKVAKPTKPARKPPKAPSKPAKPRAKLPKAKPPKKPAKPAKKPAKPAKPKPPKKTPLSQIFGKNRHEVLQRLKGEIKRRVEEAQDAVIQSLERGHEAKDRDEETGLEYYQLIAEVENMSPHDIYTLFKSPEL